VLAEPDPATRPGRLDDSATILGCNRSQILACKPGKNVGETKHGLSPASQRIFESKTTGRPRGWAKQCLALYPNP
jgi:hypothetical protein